MDQAATAATAAPTPELPPYPGLSLDKVVLVETADQAREAVAVLAGQDAVGFDTESKPTFRKGEASTGPHLLQLAVADRAWLFSLADGFDPAWVAALLADETVAKVGFGLRSDVARLDEKFGLRLAGVVDLSVALGGRRKTFGAKSAVAHFLGRSLRKSKRISTTNWSRLPYTPAQMLYAANDAQAALAVYREWRRRGGMPADGPLDGG